MKLKVLTVLALLAASACTSTDEQPVAEATEPVAEAAATAEAAPVEEAKAEEAAPAEEAPAAQAAEAEKSGGMFVAVTHLNVRSGPGMSHPAIEVITFNAAVENLGIENAIWVKIAEGKYVSRKYLSESKMSEPMAVNVGQATMAAPVESPAVMEEAPADAQEEAPVEAAEEAAAEEAPATEVAP